MKAMSRPTHHVAFAFHRGPLGGLGRCVYRRADHALVYKADAVAPNLSASRTLADEIDDRLRIDHAPPSFFVVADTLTLVFTGAPYTLVSFDAYTNERLWAPRDQPFVPSLDGEGDLRLVTGPDVGHAALTVHPHYETVPDRSWVRIILSNEPAEGRYLVGRDLVIGLRDAAITEIVMLNVRLE